MHPETALQARWRGRRLLVVDDDEVNRDVLVGLLAAVGIHADSAHDGARALALARTTSYDVVLMDILMPVMNGLEATRAIRQLPGYLTVRMIAISASARVEDRRRARNAGLDDFISKPYTSRTLYSTLLRWLPGERDARIDRAVAVTPRAITPSNRDLARQLTTVAGLDVAHGLPYASGDLRGYVRLVRSFLASANAEIASCRTCLAAADLGGARRAVHALKGAASFVGAPAVREAAAALEAQIETRADPARLDQGLIRLETARKALEAIRNAQSSATGREAEQS